jgi:hypothetical protein
MRIRSTKPEFWRSERIASVDWEARLVLKALESYVDDNGVGKDDVALIVGDLFQRDLVREPSRTLARLTEAIGSLSQAGLLHRYVVDGTHLLYISFWESIQRIDKPLAGRLPRPDGTMNYKDSTIGASLATPRESSRSLAPGTGEQGNRGTEEQGNRGTPTSSHQDDADDAAHELETVSPDTVFPRSWRPATRHQAYALEHRLDIGHEAQMFAEHAKATGRTARDWDAAFMTWLGKAKKSGGRSSDRQGEILRAEMAAAQAHDAQHGRELEA